MFPAGIKNRELGVGYWGIEELEYRGIGRLRYWEGTTTGPSLKKGGEP
jgi:hypothetical protein